MAKKITDALDGSSAKGRKLHTHAVTYERADNGGLHARVERHTKEGHHHTEHHVLSSPDDAMEHLQEHLGDQPQIGGGSPPDQAPAPAPGGGQDMMGAMGGGPAPGPM